MMIRERRGAHTATVLLIRVSWDPGRKRSVQKVLASFPRGIDTLPASLTGPDSPLTPAEQAEAAAWIADRVARTKLVLLPGVGRQITHQATELAAALEDPNLATAALADLDHIALYDAVDRLGKALRKHHRSRPPRRPKAAVPSASAESA